jgi:hypothetical protein
MSHREVDLAQHDPRVDEVLKQRISNAIPNAKNLDASVCRVLSVYQVKERAKLNKVSPALLSSFYAVFVKFRQV